jgi:hypothetical protein
MENRDRDNMNDDESSVNRNTSDKKGRVENDSNADFGKNIGRSENLENEPSRRSNSDNSIGNESSRRNTSNSEH